MEDEPIKWKSVIWIGLLVCIAIVAVSAIVYDLYYQYNISPPIIIRGQEKAYAELVTRNFRDIKIVNATSVSSGDVIINLALTDFLRQCKTENLIAYRTGDPSTYLIGSTQYIMFHAFYLQSGGEIVEYRSKMKLDRVYTKGLCPLEIFNKVYLTDMYEDRGD